VMMRSPGPSLLLSFSGDVHPFYDLAHLAYLLALAVGKTDKLDLYWQKHLAPLELQLADAAPNYGLAAWHTLSRRPELIDPLRPEARRNWLPGDETPEIHSEVVEGHALHVRDGAHCWRCGHRFGALARVVIWLADGRSRCYECREPVAYYPRSGLEVALAVALLGSLIAGAWLAAAAWLPSLAPGWRALAAVALAVFLFGAAWGTYLAKRRKLVRWSRYE